MDKYGLGGRPDYSDLSNIKTAKQKREEKQQKMIDQDLQRISEAIASDNLSEMIDTHRSIDGKYQTIIPEWGSGMFYYDLDRGFSYSGLEETSDISTLVHNLKLMASKIEGLRAGFKNVNKDSGNDSRAPMNISVNNTNTNTNSNTITLTFEQAKQQLEDMPGLDQEATEELQQKVDELEAISKESVTKKKKWEKIKPILQFVLDKGADVGIMFMSLVLQMKM